ncbi:MAG: lamin tail domain-containing protein [Candidatus Methanoplasma sp.]|jgi:hypothetical protein|nr:lamin tail domain-containing protein [Candidatus Methanoplasma sp.]
MRRSVKRIKRSKDGSMPFVVIGVVLLILGSAYAVMFTQVNDIKETADNIVTELGSLDSAIESTKTTVERGLGELIFSISTDPDGGSLEKRAKAFKERSSAWMRSNFPYMDRGVSVTIIDFDFVLEAEPLKLASSDAFVDGYTPSYLKATGHYTARFISGSGTSVRTTAISTDGTCALPLVAEKGSLFDVMVSGEGSALSQMMAHQLTALAQYRVLNGYGALAEYGSMGTMSIITPADVTSSYESSMKVLELLVFRCPSEGLGKDIERIDIADIFVSEDGFIELDLSAVYSQALISIADTLALRWFDYLYGNQVIDMADWFTDGLQNAWDSLVGFFTGTNEFSAAPYIERVMRDNGLDIDRYSRLFTGRSVSIKTSEINVTINNKNIKVPSLTVSPAYPSVDLMGWEGISKFKGHYMDETNEIREWIRNVINSAAVCIGSSKALGTIRIPIDPKDSETFMVTLGKTVDKALRGGDQEIERIMTSAIRDQRISDPFYAAIYKVIADGRDNIYGVCAFRENVRSSVGSALIKFFDDSGIEYSGSDLGNVTDILIGGDAVRRAVSDYERAVDDCMNGLMTLTEVPAGRSCILKDICTAIFGAGVLFIDITMNVPEMIRMLCREAVENTNINGYSGLTDLPGTDNFRFVGSDRNTSVERLSISVSSSPKVNIKGPNDNLRDCVHYVGFSENYGASYSTAFSITVEDSIEYTVKSAGVVERALGICDSVFRGSSEVDLEIKIIVASGWELAGVRDYRPSNTLLEDVWNTLVKLLAPFLEPLRMIISMIIDAVTILNSGLFEFAKYLTSVIDKLYNALMEPLGLLAKFVEEKLGKLCDLAMLAAVGAVQQKEASKQAVGFTYMGFSIKLTTDGPPPADNIKTLLTVTMSCTVCKLLVSGTMTIKQKGSGADRELLLSGGGEVSGNDWSVIADIDPLMRSSDQMLCLNGHVRGVQLDVALPYLVQYQHAEFSLCDIPVVGAVLSSIPLPVPGLKASIDAGIDLKYSIPYDRGILINEFELNPPGPDRDNEWVELYNATGSSVDLGGYTIHAGSDPVKKVHTITDLTLSPWGRAVVYLPGAFLNNDGSALIPEGECVILRSPDGKEVDRTPAKKDTKDNDYTWQRVADGAKEWVFAVGTPGASNCGGIFGGSSVKVHMLNILQASVLKVFDTTKSLKSTDDLSVFFQTAIVDAINEGIDIMSACIVEASIFVSLDIRDAGSVVCTGVRIALSVDSEFVGEGLKYLIGEIESILLNIENPYGIRPKEVFADHLYLGVTIYAGLTTPSFLKILDPYPLTKLGIHVDTNAAGLCRLVGSDLGEWKVTAGVVIMDAPSVLLPSVLKADKNLDSDLWLMHAVFTKYDAGVNDT